VEFSYNNSIHTSTQTMPFMLNTSYNPCMGFEPLKTPVKDKSVDKFQLKMERAVKEAKAAIAKAQNKYTLYYN
jgi:hypothetical protein